MPNLSLYFPCSLVCEFDCVFRSRCIDEFRSEEIMTRWHFVSRVCFGTYGLYFFLKICGRVLIGDTKTVPR